MDQVIRIFMHYICFLTDEKNMPFLKERDCSIEIIPTYKIPAIKTNRIIWRYFVASVEERICCKMCYPDQ